MRWPEERRRPSARRRHSTVGNGNTLLASLAPVLDPGVHTLTAQYAGDANWNSVTSAAVTVHVVTAPDFAVSATPNPLTITAGEAAALSVSSESILGFNSPIALGCGGNLPAGISCSTGTTQPGTTGTITLTSTAPGTETKTALASPIQVHRNGGARGLCVSFGSRAVAAVAASTHKTACWAALLVVPGLLGAGGILGCGNDDDNGGGAPPGSASSIVLTSSSTKVASGASVTLRASLTGGNPLKGTVTFYEGATALGAPVSAADGTASLNIASLGVGTHALTATYTSDGDDKAAQQSNVVNQTITGQFNVTIQASAGGISHPITVPVTLR